MKLESLKSGLFNQVPKSQLKEIKGGQRTFTTASGTIKVNERLYDFIADVKENGHQGFLIPELGIVWID